MFRRWRPVFLFRDNARYVDRSALFRIRLSLFQAGRVNLNSYFWDKIDPSC